MESQKSSSTSVSINSKKPTKNTEQAKTVTKSKTGSTNLFKRFGSIFSPPNLPKKSNLKFELQNLSIENLDSYNTLSHYKVGICDVYIVVDPDGKVFYFASEPPIGKNGKALYTQIMNYLFVSLSYELTEEEDINEFVRKKILEIAKELGIFRQTVKILDEILYYAIRDSFGHGIIDVFMKDPNIEDIVQENFESPVGIAHKDFGDFGILDTNVTFHSLDYANSFVQKLVQKTEKSMTAAVPYIDTMTKEGHRIAATFGKEVSLPGPNFTIRKFGEEPFTITKLLQVGTISILMAAYVWLLLESKAFLLVIGATSAGKTTTIGALNSLINPQMKITTIEDTPELKIGQTHWQRLITRKGSSIFTDKYEVTMDELIKLSLRSRPDYIIVGEVRGSEISSLIQAVATGHGGLTSFHAFDANSAFVRMESPPMNVHIGGQMLISAILHQNRLVDADGKISRKIVDITEVVPVQNQLNLEKIFKWDPISKKFTPEDIDDLVRRSIRLKEIAATNGWSKQELVAQIVTRMCYLSKMMRTEVTKFAKVSKAIERFYYNPLEKYQALLDTHDL